MERIGHRGAPREFLENTLPAFDRALTRGADAVELDVHLTADSVPVVHHDPVLRLEIGGKRTRRSILSMTWKQLDGAELAPNVFVPSLEQVLDLVGLRGVVYVELKGEGVEGRALDVIGASRARCAVHSFDHTAIVRVARLAPALRRGILFEKYPDDIGRSMRETSALDVWPQWQLIDAKLVERVHTAGGRVIAWTVNATVAAEQLIALGVDALCGDDVRLLPV